MQRRLEIAKVLDRQIRAGATAYFSQKDMLSLLGIKPLRGLYDTAIRTVSLEMYEKLATLHFAGDCPAGGEVSKLTNTPPLTYYCCPPPAAAQQFPSRAERELSITYLWIIVSKRR